MNYFRSMLFAAAVLALGTAAYAQQTIFKADVPFSFMVGSKLYPAGEYAIAKTEMVTPVLLIYANGDPQPTQIITVACSAPTSKKEQTKLVFEMTGGVYFLHQIWVAGDKSGRELGRNPVEFRLAQNGATSKEVVVAGNLTHR